MKKLLICSVLSLTGMVVFGQGQVNMNTAAGNAYVRFSNSVAQVWGTGTEYSVGLYYAADAATLSSGGGTLVTVGGPANNGFANFGTAATAGFVTLASGGGNRTVGPGGTLAFFQLRAWTAGFASYDAAKGQGDAATFISVVSGTGAAPIVSATPAPAGNPVPQIAWAPGSSAANPFVAYLVPVPEPSTLALVGMGLVGLIFIRRRK